jgi:hypothetical protein
MGRSGFARIAIADPRRLRINAAAPRGRGQCCTAARSIRRPRLQEHGGGCPRARPSTVAAGVVMVRDQGCASCWCGPALTGDTWRARGRPAADCRPRQPGRHRVAYNPQSTRRSNTDIVLTTSAGARAHGRSRLVLSPGGQWLTSLPRRCGLASSAPARLGCVLAVVLSGVGLKRRSFTNGGELCGCAWLKHDGTRPVQ